MPVTLQHNDLAIELFDDGVFNTEADSPTSYNIIIQSDKDKAYKPISQHAIKIYRNNSLINSGIILASGGATGVGYDGALIDEDNLIIRCCNKVFSLTLPDLNTNWITEADWATCFSLNQYHDTYISHGEISIARIDREGKVLWSYGGADIFVCIEEGTPFEMFDTYIALTDFNGGKYTIDYDGNTIDYQAYNHYKKMSKTIKKKRQRSWWKFW